MGYVKFGLWALLIAVVFVLCIHAMMGDWEGPIMWGGHPGSFTRNGTNAISLHPEWERQLGFRDDGAGVGLDGGKHDGVGVVVWRWAPRGSK